MRIQDYNHCKYGLATLNHPSPFDKQVYGLIFNFCIPENPVTPSKKVALLLNCIQKYFQGFGNN